MSCTTAHNAAHEWTVIAMAEYITKEQALEAVRGKMWPGEIEAAIKSISAADVVKVVRCKNCYKLYPDGNGGMLNYCRVHHVFVNTNDFCSYGSRMDGEPL